MRILAIGATCCTCAAVGLLTVLTGCGGGGGAKPAATPTRNGLARFDVDVNTGKVTITNLSARAVYTGGAVSFTSSALLSVGGDAGKRLIRVKASNQSGEPWLAGGRLVVADIEIADIADLKSKVQVSTFSGNGTDAVVDGYRTSASFSLPIGIASAGRAGVDPLYVGEFGGQVVRRIQPDGMVATFAGQVGVGGFMEGTGANAQFNRPRGVACDQAGNVFVADSQNHRIRRITPLGQVTTVAGTGVAGGADGLGDVATFNSPQYIACTPDGDWLWVTCFSGHTVRCIHLQGSCRDIASSYVVLTIAGQEGTPGFVDGDDRWTTRLRNPLGIARIVDSGGAESLFVADAENRAIRIIMSPRSEYAKVSTVVGDGTSGTADGPGSTARCDYPRGVCGMLSPDNTPVVFIGDSSRVRMVTMVAGGDPRQKGSYAVQTIAGTTSSGHVDGNGNDARFGFLWGMWATPTTGASAAIYATDSGHYIRTVIVPSGVIHTGGSGGSALDPVTVVNWDDDVPNRTAWSFALDGPGPEYEQDIQFRVPSGVSGFSFTAWIEADSSVVNYPGVGSATVTTLAGSPLSGYADGPGRQARFAAPEDVVAVPASLGAMYHTETGLPVRAFVADANNDRIRAIGTDGVVSTFAGGVRGMLDGVGRSAQFCYPRGLSLFPDGTLAVCDTGNHAIRRVWRNGLVTTIAGNGTAGSANGPGDAARFNRPFAVAVSAGGMVYVADTDNHTIRRITQKGSDATVSASYSVVTVAGQAGSPGYREGLSDNARFDTPTGLAVARNGDVFVADAGNKAIRHLHDSYAPDMEVTTLVTMITPPNRISVDRASDLYVTTWPDPSLNVYLKRVGPSGSDVTVAGGAMGFEDGSPGKFSWPTGVSVEEAGTILVADEHAIRAVQRVVDRNQGTQ